jgi:hypothetical protein
MNIDSLPPVVGIGACTPNMQEAMHRMAKALREAGTKVLLIPSPHRIIAPGVEYTDYETSAFYTKWLQSGCNLEEYQRHQDEGFPLFEENRGKEPRGVATNFALPVDFLPTCDMVISLRRKPNPTENFKLKLVNIKSRKQ